MAYIPPIAPNARRFPSPVVRPSGALRPVRASSTDRILRITNMPREGRVFVNGNDITTSGDGWADPEQTVFDVVLSSPVISTLRIEDANGNARVMTSPSDINVVLARPGSGMEAVRYTVWDALTRTVGTLRIYGAPHSQVRINSGTVLLQGTPSGTAMLYELPEGNNSISIIAPDNYVYPVSTVTIVRGQTTQLPLVRPAAPTVTPVIGVGPIALPLTPTARPATGTLVLTGAREGWTAALARINPSPATIGAIRFDATGSFTQAGLPVGSYAVLVGRAGGDSQTRPVMIAAGTTTTENVGSYFPVAAATGQLTVTGEPGWVVALAAAGSTAPLTPPVEIPSTGAIAVPVPVGSYNLGVQNTHGARMQAITVTAAGLAIDTRTFAATAPVATGGGAGGGAGGAGGGAPTTSDVTVIGPAAWVLTLLLAGADAPTARMPILANGRATFPLAAGTYKLTVDDGAGHVESRTITVPASAPIDVSTWITGSSQQNVETGANKPPPADNLPVREVDRFCGPVLNRPAWAPASMCPGDTIAGPDGNYRALAAANGVELVKLKADGTVDDSMATSTKVLIGATILGAAAVGWYFWKSSKGGKSAKVENPGKCSCQH